MNNKNTDYTLKGARKGAFRGAVRCMCSFYVLVDDEPPFFSRRSTHKFHLNVVTSKQLRQHAVRSI